MCAEEDVENFNRYQEQELEYQQRSASFAYKKEGT